MILHVSFGGGHIKHAYSDQRAANAQLLQAQRRSVTNAEGSRPPSRKQRKRQRKLERERAPRAAGDVMKDLAERGSKV